MTSVKNSWRYCSFGCSRQAVGTNIVQSSMVRCGYFMILPRGINPELVSCTVQHGPSIARAGPSASRFLGVAPSSDHLEIIEQK